MEDEERQSRAPVVAYLGLGSNLGDRLGYLRRAIAGLQTVEGVDIVAVSSVYESDPIGPEQPEYLNAVLKVSVTLSPAHLLSALHKIEDRLGRTRKVRWGPRTVDLDLLLYGDQVIETEQLTVPHPEMLNRSFVIVPLLEIDDEVQLPSGRRPSASSLPPTDLRRFARAEDVWQPEAHSFLR